MMIATTSSSLHLFPKDQRSKIRGVGCKSIDFSKSEVLAPQKRQHSDEETPPPVKRQKKTIEVDSSSTKAKYVDTLIESLHKSVSKSKQETCRTKPDKEKAVTTTLKPYCLHETQTKKVDLRSLVAKAQHKIQEKRLIDHRAEEIARHRLAARLALTQMEATAGIYKHLNYHKELEERGYTFIQYEVDCLNMFNSWSRSDYNAGSNSILGKDELPWLD